MKLFIPLIAIVLCGSLVFAEQYSGCNDPNLDLNGKTCQEITACQTLSTTDRYYLLMNDVYSEKNCFYITRDDITLDLNEHTVTFDESTPFDGLNFDFEMGSGRNTPGWDLSNAPDATLTTNFYPGEDWAPELTGNQVLEFTDSTNEQYLYSDYFSLEEGEQYVLSAIVRKPVFNQGNNLKNFSIEIEGDGGCVAVDRSWNTLVQWSNDVCTFNSGSGQYRIKISIPHDISVGEGATGPLYVDAVEIRRASIQLSEGHLATKNYIGIIISRFHSGIKITNGYVKQGSGNSYYAVGVAAYNTGKEMVEGDDGIWYSVDLPLGESTRTSIDNLIIELNGTDSYGTYLRQSNNVIVSDNKYLPNDQRRTMYGHNGGTPAIGGTYNGHIEIAHNTIDGMPSGIIFTTDNVNLSIHHNNISIYGNAIHDWSISLAAHNGLYDFDIYNNYIKTDRGCGIAFDAWEHFHDGPHHGRIYNNYVEVSDSGVKEERGWVTKAVWGRYGIHDLNFTNNTFITRSGNINGMMSRGVGIRIGTDPPYGTNLYFENNYIEASTNTDHEDGEAIALSLDSDFLGREDETNYFGWDVKKDFINNEIVSNDVILALSGTYGGVFGPVLLKDNLFVRKDYSIPSFQTIISGYHTEGADQVTLLDNEVSGGADVHDISFYSGASATYDINYTWTLGVSVKNPQGSILPGAQVTVEDAQGNVKSFTQQNEPLEMVLPEQYYYGILSGGAPSSIRYSPYTVTVDYGGAQQTSQVVLNEKKDIEFIFNSDSFWSILYQEDFDSSQSLNHMQTFGENGWLTSELHNGGSIDVSGGIAHFLTEDHLESAMIRTTSSLPDEYKIRVHIGNVDTPYQIYDDTDIYDPDFKYNCIDPDAYHCTHPENGFYWMTPTDIVCPSDTGCGEDWWHTHRKAVLDSDEHPDSFHPLYMVYMNPEAFNPDGSQNYHDELLRSWNGADDFWNTANGNWEVGYTWTPNTWYYVEMEKANGVVIMRLFDDDLNLLEETDPVDLDLIHNMGSEASPNEFMYFGEPHIDSYEGSADISQITLFIKQGPIICGNLNCEEGENYLLCPNDCSASLNDFITSSFNSLRELIIFGRAFK